MRRNTRKKFYALPVMAAIAVVAVLTTIGGFALRRTVLSELPQYDGVPDIAIPMMLLQDSGPLREARERRAWEESQEADDWMEGEQTLAMAPAQEAAESEAAAIPDARPQATEGPATQAPAVTEAPATQAPVVTAAPVSAEPAAEAQPQVQDELLPVATEVPESFFDHTLFIGDSKTDGLKQWGRLGQAQYFCGTNYSVYNVFDKVSSDVAFKKVKLDTVLAKGRYDQIYIMLGYNECGYPYKSLMKQFRYVIARVHKAQPQARVILHGIMHASARVAGKYSYYTVAHIEKVNDGLRELAAGVDGLYYVDCNEFFCDENGFLFSDVSKDGEHLTAEYTAQWAQHIRQKAIAG